MSEMTRASTIPVQLELCHGRWETSAPIIFHYCWPSPCGIHSPPHASVVRLSSLYIL